MREAMSLTVLVAVLCALAGAAFGQITVDGFMDPLEYGAPLAAQTAPTGFGDNLSELNALYAKFLPSGALAMGLTGNLEANGNGIVVFLDLRSGGAVETVLGGGYGQIGSIGGQWVDDWGTDTDGSDGVNPTPGGGSILDPGFDPDIAIEVNTNDSYLDDGHHYFVNIVDLTYPNDDNLPNKDIYLGSNLLEGAGVAQDYYRDSGATWAGTVTHAFSNANMAGVWGWDFGNPPGALGDPLTASLGLELLMSPEFLAVEPGHVVKALAFITNASGDWLSNQFLPGLGLAENPGGPGDPGGVPLFDASVYPGDQFVVIPEPAALSLLALGGVAALRRRRRT